MSRIGTRSPRPSTAHHTWDCRLAAVAAPLSRSTKYCSSSMRDEGPGRTCCTNGPPVLKPVRVTGSSKPLGDLKPLFTCTVQFTPGGRSFSNSKAHSRSLVQRPLPRVAWASLQLSDTGAGALASPKLTALSLNLTTTWRTRATSPWGETLVICSADAGRAMASHAVAAKRSGMLFFKASSMADAKGS